jgi:hypothetical protein
MGSMLLQEQTRYLKPAVNENRQTIFRGITTQVAWQLIAGLSLQKHERPFFSALPTMCSRTTGF